MPMNNKIYQSVALCGFMILSVLGIVRLQQAKIADIDLKKTAADYQQEAKSEAVKLELLSLLPSSFGFGNLIADWTLLQFIQYYGDSRAREVTGSTLSPEYFKIIVDNDPLFVRAYLILSPASSINAGRPDITIQEMTKGLKSLTPNIPDAYMVWLYKGVDQLLFLGDIEGAKHSYQMAADWAKIAGDVRIENAARNTVNFLNKNPDSREAQVGAWFLVFLNSSDAETRALAKREIEKIGGTISVSPDGRVTAKAPKDEE